MSKRNRKREAKLRDWIAAHLPELAGLVKNLDEAMAAKEAELAAFAKADCKNLQQLGAASVKAVLNRKALLSLRAFKEGLPLFSLGTEIPLIVSRLPGPNPSADILGLQTQSAGYVIVEIKNAVGAARQAITELSAYANGLGGRFWGVSSFDSIWLLISSDYRPTLSEAIAYQLLASGRCIIPLQAKVTWNGDKVVSVVLSVQNVAVPPDVFTSDAILSDDVFDGVAAHVSRPKSSPDVALHFLASMFGRTGAAGCCFELTDALQLDAGSKVYAFAALTLNPFKLHLKALRLKELVKKGMLVHGSADYEQEIRNKHEMVSLDADAGTFKTLLTHDHSDDDDAAAECTQLPIAPNRSLQELAEREPNSQTLAFMDILEQLALRDGSSLEPATFHPPDWLSPSLGQPQLREDNISSVRYFGVIQDIVSECAEYLLRNDRDFSDKSFLQTYESPLLLLKILGAKPLQLKAAADHQ